MKKAKIFFLCFAVFLIMNIGYDHGADAGTIKAETKLEMGDEAPGFMLKNQDQLNVSLSDFRGKKNVVLVFYPLDFTPV